MARWVGYAKQHGGRRSFEGNVHLDRQMHGLSTLLETDLMLGTQKKYSKDRDEDSRVKSDMLIM